MKQLPERVSPPEPIQIGNGRSQPTPRSRPKWPLKWLLYLGLGVGAIGLSVLLLRPAPLRVDTGTIQRGTLQVTVDAEGKTRVRDRFVIAAGTAGHLDRITLNEGDPVKPGMVVARIDPLPLNASIQQALGRLSEWKAQRAGVATQRPKAETLQQAETQIQAAQARQQQAEARVAEARAALQQAQRDRQRAQDLFSAGAISRQARESAELNETTKARDLDAAILAANAEASAVDVARAQLAVLQKQQTDPDYLLRVYEARIASTEAELAQLRDEANRTDVRSPVAGRVLRVLQKSAQFVSNGTPLLEIGDASQLELVIDVLSNDALKIRPGDRILIDVGRDTPPVQAKVRRVEPSAFTKVSALGVEEQRVNVIGDFVNPTPEFGDAYRVAARIIVWEGKNVLKAPLSALFRCQQTAWCTFVVINGRAQQRPVQIGQCSDFEAEIRQGLQPGDTVILHPTEQIKNGDRVTSR
ncbi:MAG: efflux RND transporter periplasmic adaptor subunit [Leptodesmis sp.]|uniref:efflux RND transporter periplasmic adaptor subunit n=1 Tax=Leptodesmis sp. TaxID=3100501 RepID=UPI003D0A5038